MSNGHDLPFPGVTVYTFGLGTPPEEATPDKPPSVVIRERGCMLDLRFAKRRGDSPLLELRLLPDGAKRLDPKKAREIVPRIDDYLAVARAALAWDFTAVREAAEVLRQAGRPGRGHSDDFYRLIAMEYEHLVEAGEKAPVKTLAQKHHVVISAASRWLTEARHRGHLPQKGTRGDG